MMHQLTFGDTIIPYIVTKSTRRKTSEIIVSKEGVEIKTPNTKTDSEIKQLMSSKAKWIFEKQLQIASREHTIQSSVTPKTTAYLEGRVWQMASRMNLKPTRIVTKNLKSRWGSCTKNGVITINASLAQAPQAVVDYVAVHELSHLKFHDHSWRFWRLVKRYCQDYELQIKWLDSHSRDALIRISKM